MSKANAPRCWQPSNYCPLPRPTAQLWICRSIEQLCADKAVDGELALLSSTSLSEQPLCGPSIHKPITMTLADHPLE
jgi:hypothetical protein